MHVLLVLFFITFHPAHTVPIPDESNRSECIVDDDVFIYQPGSFEIKLKLAGHYDAIDLEIQDVPGLYSCPHINNMDIVINGVVWETWNIETQFTIFS